MSNKKKIVLWIFLILFALGFLVSTAIIIIKAVKVNGEPIGSEAAVGVFSLIGTIVGAFFVVIELKNSNDVTCCQMLIDLNNYFHDNDRLMKVYAVLDKSHLWCSKDEDLWKDVEDQDVEFFCTFFENLYLLVEHKIARIKDLDNIFGYRFFLFMNDPHIQEKYLLTSSSSFINLFRLYELWINYRDKLSKKNAGAIIIGNENRFTNEYLKNQVYLVDNGVGKDLYQDVSINGKIVQIRDVWFDELSQVLALEKLIHEHMEDQELFVDVTRNEFIESLHLDYVLGAYDEDKLVAVALIITNRESDRNLAKKVNYASNDVYTFDAVFVKEEYRGHGLQKIFIDITKKQAIKDHAKYIMTTVSSKNTYSYKNMIDSGFTPLEKDVIMYNGHHRDILKLDIKN